MGEVKRALVARHPKGEWDIYLTFDWHDDPEVDVQYTEYRVLRNGEPVLVIEGHKAICDFLVASPILEMLSMTDGF